MWHLIAILLLLLCCATNVVLSDNHDEDHDDNDHKSQHNHGMFLLFGLTIYIFIFMIMTLISLSITAHHSTSSVCLPGQFRCQLSQECIPMGWLCDGENDCGMPATISVGDGVGGGGNNYSGLIILNDTSDEDIDRCSQSNVCPNNYFRCANLITCIPLKQLCDSIPDCPDMSDELNFCGTYIINEFL